MAAGRKLLYTQDFDGPAGVAPPANWVPATGGSGWGNNELETYTARTQNAQLDGNGNLAIIARSEAYVGTDNIPRSYTSARLVNQHPVQYGYIEARINLPAGQGLWPAFWTMGAESLAGGSWPACGEIDIMESINSMAAVSGTMHGPSTAVTGNYGVGGQVAPTSDPLAGSWHLYGIDWTPTSVTWYLDGVAYFTSAKADLPAGDTWEFDKPHVFLLNVAVGGTWPGPPSPATVFPATMLVDYVRQYSNSATNPSS